MCISFAAITIPSLKNQEAQLSNYISALQCALSNNLISETDSLYRAALKHTKTLLGVSETYFFIRIIWLFNIHIIYIIPPRRI